eukprot:7607516-Alexandrium_andersonii.AAC.1
MRRFVLAGPPHWELMNQTSGLVIPSKRYGLKTSQATVPSAGANPLVASAPQLRASCLLYTSDAADDM